MDMSALALNHIMPRHHLLHTPLGKNRTIQKSNRIKVQRIA
jgi:hypothetical protein